MDTTIEQVDVNNKRFRLVRFDNNILGGYWYVVYVNDLHYGRPSTLGEGTMSFGHGTSLNNLGNAALYFDKLAETNRRRFRDRIYYDDAIAPELLNEYPPNQFMNWPVG